ncbi:aspartic proteinase nepenthesin-2-like [Canna indica]|uniref:Aspartic proteinase nepenthesin-2-like n=1 Tax=Canna indica TaxID=4628 RepID=A0AAQ3QNI3_9LILI|nr:aspartic proteinase nepenthesin-2-like [Canna indica]
MRPQLLLLLFCFHGFLAAAGRKHSASLRLELLRHPAPPALSELENAQNLFRHDQLRQQMIQDRIAGHHHRRRACDVSVSSKNLSSAPAPAAAESFAMPLKSAAYTGTGQYFVRFLLGTPAQRFLLVADTGSDLTWVKCRRHRGGNATRVFRPEASTTFRSIPCSSDMCKTSLPFSLTTCPTPASPCAYDYGYSDGSTAQGVFANESATVILSNTHRTKLRGLVVGCTSSSDGSSFRSSDGVLGLGNSDISFASRAAARFGGRFSYCLVDHLSPRNASSFLTFGPNPAALRHPPPRETPLLLDLEPFYSVSVVGISVDGELLPIPESVWDAAAGGGAILDSGTSLTVLAEPAYRAVTKALSRRLAGVPRVSVDPFEYCYNWTRTKVKEEELPRMVLHLGGSARLEPPAKSYVIDVADGVKCLGIAAAPWPAVSTVGNILQQEHLWEFDIEHRRLRFKRSTCAVD